MRKTTVYLSDDEVEGLRRLSAQTGASQSDLIRRGLQAVLGEPPADRVFHSLGRGASGGGARRWSSSEVYEKAFPGRTVKRDADH
jgi:hypothetical protein